MNQNADYMAHAKNAAKLASQIAFEEDESLVSGQVGPTSQNDHKKNIIESEERQADKVLWTRVESY